MNCRQCLNRFEFYKYLLFDHDVGTITTVQLNTLVDHRQMTFLPKSDSAQRQFMT